MSEPSSRERKVCGAKTRSGAPCKLAPVTGRTRCALHGGKTLTGIASGTFKTGRYSKYLPARLLDRYQQAAADPDLLALRHDIALSESRLTELIERVDSGEAGQAWREARAAWDTFREAQHTKDTDAMRVSLDTLDSVLGRGVSDYAAWDEIKAEQQNKRKLVESEQKRLVAMQQMVTAEQAMVFVTALQDSVRRHVSDRDALRAIAADMAALVTTQRVAA